MVLSQCPRQTELAESANATEDVWIIMSCERLSYPRRLVRYIHRKCKAGHRYILHITLPITASFDDILLGTFLLHAADTGYIFRRFTVVIHLI
jgi:hypothetical protein